MSAFAADKPRVRGADLIQRDHIAKQLFSHGNNGGVINIPRRRQDHLTGAIMFSYKSGQIRA